MKIQLKRTARKDTYTIGKVQIDGKYFCDSLEDTDRGATQVMPFTPTGGSNGYWTVGNGQRIEKVYGKTAIPTGLYDACSYFWPKHKCYVVQLLRVPGFTGILLHNGTNADHSEGCPLLGKNNIVGRLNGDRIYMDALVARVMAAEKLGERIKVEVI
ncbi:MAG: hypothetical protein IKV77_05120 [Alistipes sp.]|nr:hypothetical protein [Bacteroidales bacterium]MBR5492493.1 hypothetical protein [Alistipes sp.]MBR5920056.1 hypothetical protein [Bacteroidales bacterium]